MDRDIIIALLAQIPIALYSIITGILNFRANVRKTHAESDASLGTALKGAGETLDDAWDEIRDLRRDLREERTARERLEKENRHWRRYSIMLFNQVIDVGHTPIPPPPDSQDMTGLAGNHDPESS